MDNIKNYFDQSAGGQQDEEEDFKDQPEEITGKEAPPVDVAVARPQRPSAPMVQLGNLPPEDDEIDYAKEDSDDDVDSDILSDARLRLEQGRLYELVMKHDLFEGVDADPKAIRNVQKEIRAYAQERMEIMLGMRQEKSEAPSGFPAELFPFNSLEVEALKAIAATATKGASREAEPFNFGSTLAPARTSLKPIGNGVKPRRPMSEISKDIAGNRLAKTPKTPVPRAKVDATVQRILDEEGLTIDDINQVFDPRKKYLTPEELASLTQEQVIERNRQIKNKQVPSRSALPMPSPEQINQAIEMRANQAAANPQLQQIMGLLDEAQKKKGK